MDREDTGWLDRLAGPDGTALLDRIADTDLSEQEVLRVGTALRREHDPDLVAAASTLATLRGRAGAKFGRARRMWFTRDGLEQASSEAIARHRAARYAGRARVTDLCCGIGGDLVALAVAGHDVTGVDLDPVHLWMAARNASVHDARVRTVRSDVRDADLSTADGVFVDPARRSGGGRMRTGDSEPPLDWCLDLAGRVDAVGIKAAPGIDHGTVPLGWELEFLALGRELKEAVLWSPALAGPRTRATVVDGERVHTLGGEPDPADGDTGVAVGEPGEWLLDPNPAITRAGLVSELARRTGTTRIDPRIAFLTGGTDPEPTPFARTLRVVDSRPWDQKRLPRLLRELDVGAVEVRRRGLAGDVDALTRALRGRRGGRRATVVMTRVGDRPWGLVCVDP